MIDVDLFPIPQISEFSTIYPIIVIFVTMESFIISNGISMHIWDTKDEGTPAEAPAMVLLHGYLETMYIFNELVASLKGKYRVIVLDLPGHGLTDSAPAGEDGVSVNSVEFDVPVICGVLDKLGVESALIAGHSMGGYITLECIKECPERFSKALLLCSHPYPDAPEVAQNRDREINVVLSGKLPLLAEASIPKMYCQDNLRKCDEKIRETVELCEMHDPEGIVASIRGIKCRPDLRGVLQNPPCPVILIHGDHDNFLSLERVTEMKTLFPKVTYCLIPNCGHNPFIEDTPATVAAIDLFCGC